MAIMKWKITFDPSYYVLDGNSNTKIVGSTFFREYEAIDAGRIIMLEIGESITLDNGYQTVERIR